MSKSTLPKLKAVESAPRYVADLNRIRTQKMSGREIREFERVQPTKVMALQQMAAKDMPYDTLLGMAWIVMRRDHPELTFDDVLDMTDDEWDLIGFATEDANDDPTSSPQQTEATAIGS